MYKCLQKYQRPKDLAPLMRQYKTAMAGSKAQKKQLFDWVEQSLLLDSSFETLTWQTIMKDCGFNFPFPSSHAADSSQKLSAYAQNLE
jgi:hypothetical protein